MHQSNVYGMMKPTMKQWFDQIVADLPQGSSGPSGENGHAASASAPPVSVLVPNFAQNRGHWLTEALKAWCAEPTPDT